MSLLAGIAKAAAPSLASAITGKIFGGGKRGPSAQDQIAIQGQAQSANIRRHWSGSMAMAKRYNIHPLVALGINPASGAQPISIDKEVGASMGQNLSRAAHAGVSAAVQNKELEKLALERAQLENDLLRSQISSINNQPGDPPAQENGSVIINPDENVSRSPNDPGLTAGSDTPPPSGKRYTVGKTPWGENITMVLPPSGQADEYGEIYGSIKGIEYLAKRGFVRLVNKQGKYLAKILNKKQKTDFQKVMSRRGY